MISVLLTPAELKDARRAAEGRRDAHGERAGKTSVIGWAGELLGCEGELAFAKAFNLPWDSALFTPAGLRQHQAGGGLDFGPAVEVRTTPCPEGRLIGHAKDPDDAVLALVRCNQKPLYVVVGWAFGREVKRQCFWEEGRHGRPCYYLPNGLLRPAGELRQLLTAAPCH